MAGKDIHHWEPVILRKSTQEIKNTTSTAQLKKQNMIVTKTKHTNTNPNPSVNLKKIENDDEEYKLPYVSSETAQKIIDGRVIKKWTRQQLAQAMSLPEATIRDIENSKAIENKQQLQSIARKLGIIL
jgi:ribosome-binding protein aMBF1 (putative translation factor)